MKDFQVTANCPKVRVFEIDSQEQWDTAIDSVFSFFFLREEGGEGFKQIC